jgi:hypothetical protein
MALSGSVLGVIAGTPRANLHPSHKVYHDALRKRQSAPDLVVGTAQPIHDFASNRFGFLLLSKKP